MTNNDTVAMIVTETDRINEENDVMMERGDDVEAWCGVMSRNIVNVRRSKLFLQPSRNSINK